MSRKSLLIAAVLCAALVSLAACAAKETPSPSPSAPVSELDADTGEDLDKRQTAVAYFRDALTQVAPTPVPIVTPTPIPTTAWPPQPTPTPQPLLDDGGALPAGAVARIGHGYLTGVDLSPDRSQIAISTTAGLYIYTLPDFERVWRRYRLEPFTSVAWSPAGDQITASFQPAMSSPESALWDVESGERLSYLPGWFSAVWSPTGAMMAIEESQQGAVDPVSGQFEPFARDMLILDGPTGLFIWRLTCQRIGISNWHAYESITWSPDERYLAAVIRGEDSALCVWDVRSGQLLYIRELDIPDESRAPVELIPHPDSQRLAVIAPPWNAPRIIDWSTDEQMLALNYEDGISSFAWSPDGQRFATAGVDGIAIQDANTGQILRGGAAPDLGGQPIRAIDWSPDGARLALSNGLRVAAVDAADLQLESEMVVGNDASQPLALFWLPDSRHLILATYGGEHYWNHRTGKIIVWDTTTDDAAAGFSSTLFPERVGWSNDGQTLAIRSEGGAVHYWYAPTRSLLEAAPYWIETPDVLFPPTPEGATIGPRWNDRFNYPSPDGRWTASTLGQGGGCGHGPFGGGCFHDLVTLTIVEAGTSRQVFSAVYENTTIGNIIWSPDGSLLALSEEALITVIEVATGEERFTLQGHSSWIADLAISPENSLLASASADGTVIVWSLNP